jgi:hypothetical protein
MLSVLTVTMMLGVGPQAELKSSDIPRITDVRDRIEIGMRLEEVAQLLPTQRTKERVIAVERAGNGGLSIEYLWVDFFKSGVRVYLENGKVTSIKKW